MAGIDLSTRVKNRGSFDDTDFSIYFTCSLRSEWKKIEFVKFGMKILSNNYTRPQAKIMITCVRNGAKKFKCIWFSLE